MNNPKAVRHLTAGEFENSVDHILASPCDAGELKLIVRRPEVDPDALLLAHFFI